MTISFPQIGPVLPAAAHRLTSRSIAAAAFDRAFGDLSSFIVAFKEAYGITLQKLRPRSSGERPPSIPNARYS
jgi:AraC-like DNA-binding protein